MLTDNESPQTDVWGLPYDENPECEFCGRSTVARFGGVPSYECDSCRADFKREYDACGGMIEVAGDEDGD